MTDGLSDKQKFIDGEIQELLPEVLKIPEPDRSRSLVCLAYEYFMVDMEEDAFSILRNVDPSYYKNEMHSDMKDGEMKHIFMSIMSKLVDTGYIKITERSDG
jgi:hypothetical protein